MLANVTEDVPSGLQTLLFRLQLGTGEALFAQLLGLALDLTLGVGENLLGILLGGRLDLGGARLGVVADVLRTRVGLFSDVFDDCVQTHW